ncbi:hypothetical protein [Ornithinimicrobium sp. INDO-MA30-4]|uniref:hypothetical protein n=1 Tax=Ornithinimicrobium sp. INDO-MA30-4 TaxID=2908651 RepID=UPI001F2C739F|nr:hypothetical protein [Ornithinimicrobium sp. INDO-MA30-4]UJH71320.1 hypothetical protein L0A91_06030 [Ornithinimicrobium sp. INDO-MA30-4]
MNYLPGFLCASLREYIAEFCTIPFGTLTGQNMAQSRPYGVQMDISYVWTIDPLDSEPTSPEGRERGSFPTQADAEAWLASEWETLVDEGAPAVSLWHGSDLVYGPMSLSAAD